MKERPNGLFGQKLSQSITRSEKYAQQLLNREVFGTNTESVLGGGSEITLADVAQRAEEYCYEAYVTFENLEKEYNWRSAYTPEEAHVIEEHALALSWRFGLDPSFFDQEGRCLVLLGIASEQVKIKRDLAAAIKTSKWEDFTTGEARRRISDDRVRLLAMNHAKTLASVPQARRDISEKKRISNQRAGNEDRVDAPMDGRVPHTTATAIYDHLPSSAAQSVFEREEPFSFEYSRKGATNSQLRHNESRYRRKVKAPHNDITNEFFENHDIQQYFARIGLSQKPSIRIWQILWDEWKFEQEFDSRANKQGDLISLNKRDGNLGHTALYRRYVRQHELGHAIIDPLISTYFGMAVEEADVSDLAEVPMSYENLRIGYNLMDDIMDRTAGKAPGSGYAFGLRLQASLKRNANEAALMEERAFHKVLISTFGVEGMMVYYAMSPGNTSLHEAYENAMIQPYPAMQRLIHEHNRIQTRNGSPRVPYPQEQTAAGMKRVIRLFWQEWTNGATVGMLSDEALVQYTRRIESCYIEMAEGGNMIAANELGIVYNLYKELWRRKYGDEIDIRCILHNFTHPNAARTAFYEWYQRGMRVLSAEDIQLLPQADISTEEFLLTEKNREYAEYMEGMLSRMRSGSHKVPEKKVIQMWLTYLYRNPEAGYTWGNEGQGNEQSRKGVAYELKLATFIAQCTNLREGFDQLKEPLHKRLLRMKPIELMRALEKETVKNSLPLDAHLRLVQALRMYCDPAGDSVPMGTVYRTSVIPRVHPKDGYIVKMSQPGVAPHYVDIPLEPPEEMQPRMAILAADYLRRMEEQYQTWQSEYESYADMDPDGYIEFLQQEFALPDTVIEGIQRHEKEIPSPVFYFNGSIGDRSHIEAIFTDQDTSEGRELLEYLERYTDFTAGDFPA